MGELGNLHVRFLTGKHLVHCLYAQYDSGFHRILLVHPVEVALPEQKHRIRVFLFQVIELLQ